MTPDLREWESIFNAWATRPCARTLYRYGYILPGQLAHFSSISTKT